MKHHWLIGLPMVLFFAALPAAADDFTFEIPITIKNMHPDITQGWVDCFTSRGIKDNGKPSIQGNDKIGDGSTAFKISSGNYHGNIIVRFNALPGMNPAEAVAYRCHLRLRDPKTKTSGAAEELINRLARGETGYAIEKFRPHPTTPASYEVWGRLH
jgi:hypothetical protein